MFIAMNRFQVKTGSEQAFETVWATRESYLSELAGFIEFNLLRGLIRCGRTRRRSRPGPNLSNSARRMPAPITRPARAFISAIRSSRASR